MTENDELDGSSSLVANVVKRVTSANVRSDLIAALRVADSLYFAAETLRDQILKHAHLQIAHDERLEEIQRLQVFERVIGYAAIAAKGDT